MANWRNCENCKDQECYQFMKERGIVTEEICDDWEPLPCKYCHGSLSVLRYHNGRPYRHCASCNFEFYEDV